MIGEHTVTLNLYGSCAATAPILTQGSPVKFDNGVYRTAVNLSGLTPAQSTAINQSETLCLGVQIDGDVEMLPRLEYGSTPYSRNAISAMTAESANVATTADGLTTTGVNNLAGSGLSSSGSQISVNTSSNFSWSGVNSYSAQVIYTKVPPDNSSANASLKVNPAGAAADAKLIAVQNSNVDKFTVDASGDLMASGTITFSSLISCGSLQTNASGLLTCGASGSGITGLTADTGGTTTGATVTLAGGTNGIDTVRSVNTITFNLDTTEINTTTFGSGAGFTWTFDASGGTDPALTFGAGSVTLNSGVNVGLGTASPNTLLDINGGIAWRKGTDYSITGSQNNVNLGANSLVRYTGAGTATFTGITGGSDGKVLTLMNASSSSLILNNNDAASTAANRIITGTNSNLPIAAGATVVLQYDSGASVWRVSGSGLGVTGLTADTGGTTSSSTVNVLGGTNGIDTVQSGGDTVTVNLDTTEINTTTFGSGAGFTWTFDASGGTDAALTFGSGSMTLNSGVNVGLGTPTPNTLLDINGGIAWRKGADYTTTGSQDNVNLGANSLVRYTGAGAAIFTGITGGADGKLLVLMNASASTLTLNNNDAASTAANRIITGTGTNFSIPGGATAVLQYDSGASFWRLTSTSPVPATNVSLSSITAAGATNSINNGNFAQSWNWSLTGATNALNISENMASTGTGYLLNVGTIAASTAKPFKIAALGSTVLDTDASGNFTFASNISQTGATTFSTGTGLSTFNGNVTQSGAGSVTTGTGLLTAGGNLTVNGTSITLAGNSSILDMTGTGILGLNTTTNRAITTGTGLLTAGGAFTSTGLITANAGENVSNTGSLALQRGADYATTGSQDDVNLGPASLVRYTGAGTATFTGISGGANGRVLVLMNASASTLTLNNNDAASTAANRIITGTGTNFSIPGGATAVLQYDSGASFWRLTSTSPVPATNVSLSSITAAGATNSINNGNFAQSWNWSLTGATNALNISENVASTGTGYLLNVGTIAASTAKPFKIAALGSTVLDTDASGNFTFASNISQTGATTFSTGTGTSTFNSTLLTLAGNSTVMNMTGTGTLGLNTTTNRAITTGTGLLTAGGAFTSTGLITANAGENVSNTGSLALQRGADYATTGSQNDVNLGPASLVRYTGAGTATFTGISGGANGRVLVLMNASASTLTLNNNDAASTAANRIITGTGTNFSIPAGATAVLQYDSGASFWRLTSTSPVPATNVALSSITAAGATNSINNGNFAQTWNWSLTGATNALNISENVASTGTGYLLNVGTIAASTAKPFKIAALGSTVLDTDASGNFTFASNISQTGAKTFSTGTGAVSLNGNTTISGANTFTSGTGTSTFNSTLINLAGNSTVVDMTGTGILGLNTTTNRAITTGTGLLTAGGAFTSTGLITGNAGATLANTGSLALQQSSYSTTGSQNNVNLGSSSFVIYRGGASATFTGIAGGADGRVLVLMNASGSTLTLNNNDAASAAGNRIITGTGTSFTIPSLATVILQYDFISSFWRFIAVSPVPATSAALSSITAATNINTIDSLNFSQTWNWSTASTENPFIMNMNALTSGNGLTLASTATGLTGSLLLVSSGSTAAATNGLVRFNFTGAHTGNGIQIDDVTTTGKAVQINANSATTGTAFEVNTNGLSSGNGVNISSTSTAAASNTQTLLNISLSGANATTTQTTYGARFSNIHTGTSSTNVGLQVSASGGTNNYALLTNGGSVGIGTTAPNNLLDINGGLSWRKGVDFSTAGTQNNVNLGSNSLVRYTGVGTATFTGITGGTDGKILVLMNASSSTLTLNNSDAGSLAANQIVTGTGSNFSIPAGATAVLQYDSGTSVWRLTSTSPVSTSLNTQTFSTPGTTTWTKPSIGNTTYIFCIGGGGGGGSGRRGLTATGGGGGAGGGVSFYTIPTSLLSASETVVVGSAGTGGAAQTADNTDGNPGTTGGDSIFRHAGTNWIIGKGGGGGGGGSTVSVTGGTAGSPCDFVSASGGNGNSGVGGNSGVPTAGAAGPGGGGGGTTLAISSNGGAAILPRGGANTGGTAPGGAGTSGLLSFPNNTPGGGGSGGASSGDGVTPGGAGGGGGNYGGGGGGGGASANGANSGKGGDGAQGLVIVITS